MFYICRGLLSLHCAAGPWCWGLKHHHFAEGCLKHLLSFVSTIVIVLYGVQYCDNKTPPPPWIDCFSGFYYSTDNALYWALWHFIPHPHWWLLVWLRGVYHIEYDTEHNKEPWLLNLEMFSFSDTFHRWDIWHTDCLCMVKTRSWSMVSGASPGACPVPWSLV